MGDLRLVFDAVIELNGTDNVFWIFFCMNLVLAIIAYELGFAKKLSIAKKVIIYLLLLIGVFILTIFSTVMRMPTVESLLVINVVLVIYRTRLHFQRKVKKKTS